MSTEPRDLVESLHKLWSTGDESMIHEIYHPDFVGYWPPSSPKPIRHGYADIQAGLRMVREAFDDWTESVEDIFQVGERVADRFRTTATHVGSFAHFEPSGGRLDFMELGLSRVHEGRIIEPWCMFDEVMRLRQLEASDAEILRAIRSG